MLQPRRGRNDTEMIIKQIETIRIESQPQIIWVQIHTDTGIVGLGETFYAPQVVDAAVHDCSVPCLSDASQGPSSATGRPCSGYRIMPGTAALRCVQSPP